MMSLAFAGFLFGVLGIAVPIILHFIKQKPTEITKFPSFMFFHKNIAVKNSRNNIRKWIILLLRCLAILLISLAFAWPYIANFAKKPKRITVYIWDNSFSMTAEPYREELKREAEDLFDQTTPETPAILGIIGSQKRWMRKLTSKPDKLKAFFDSNIPGDSDSQLNQAIRHADLILQGIECSEKEIIIFSDKQKSPWKNVDFRKKLSPGVKLSVVFPKKSGFNNAAVTSITLMEPFSSAGQELHFKIILQNFSCKKIKGTLSLYFDNQKVRNRKVNLAPSSKEKFFEEFKAFKFSHHSIRAEFSDNDDIALDNSFYLPINPVTRAKIAVNGKNRETCDYLKLSYGATSTQHVADFLQLNSPEALNANFAIIRKAPTENEEKTITKMLNKGKTIFITWDSSWEMRRFLQKFGIKTISVTKNKTLKHFGEINFEHPLFKHFMDVKIGSFFNIAFFDPPGLQPPENSEIIAKFADGTPAIFSLPASKGKVIMLSSKITRKSTNWPVHATFLPFMRELLFFAGSGTKEKNSFIVGDSIPMNGASEYSEMKSSDTRTRAVKSFSPEKPGNYLLYNNNQIEKIVSVNVDNEESENILLPKTFTPLKLVSNKSVINKSQQLSNSVFSKEQGDTFWWTILLIALLFMISELLIANRTVL